MRYKILDTDTQKEYYRKNLARSFNSIKHGVVFQVEETLTPIGYIYDGKKTIVDSLRKKR